jgi:hypothetical protein
MRIRTAVLKINVTEISACVNILEGNRRVAMMKRRMVMCVSRCIHASFHACIHYLRQYQHIVANEGLLYSFTCEEC